MFHPYELWSLWDMLKIHAEEFINLTEGFNTTSNCFLIAENKNIPITGKILHDLRQGLNLLKDICDRMGFKISSSILSQKIIDLPQNSRELDTLIDIVKEEMKLNLFLLISQDRAKYYNPDKPIWGTEIADKLADTIEDIVESNNCYSLDRHTACVFHLMRIMEKSLQKYTEKLGISLSSICDEKWQIIINQIRGQLNKLFPKHGDSVRTKHESILGHLETVKIAWRNPTMHPKATYTEEEAKSLLNAVEIFMKDLVKIL
jgi:hypothetical protein